MKGLVVAFSLLGMGGVVAGALGAHALADRLAEAGQAVAWQTAVSYLFWHVLAGIAAAGLFGRLAAGQWLRLAGVLWLAGIILFSGSIFALCLGGPGWLGPVTPFGGLALIAGWLAFTVAVWRNSGSTEGIGGPSVGGFSG